MSEFYRYGAVLLLDEEQTAEELRAASDAQRSRSINPVDFWPTFI